MIHVTQDQLKRYREFPYIAAWGSFLGSEPYYIIQQIREARYDNAPKNSIYKDTTTDEWVTFDDCRNQSAKVYIGKYVSILINE